MPFIPRKDLFPGSSNPPEAGMPELGKTVPEDEDTYSAPNIPVTKTKAEAEASKGNVGDQEGTGATNEIEVKGDQSKFGEATAQGNPTANPPKGSEKIERRLSEKEQWEEEAQSGQGGREAPAAVSMRPKE
jgi:hypothetical protein